MRRSPLAVAAVAGLAGLAGLAGAPVAAAEPAPILGGTATTVGQHPAVVGLSIGSGLCTGTLIAPSWVLTAAHCLTPSVVGLSSQDAVTQSARVFFKTVDLQRSTGTVRMAAQTLPKPGFSASALGANDIGLIQLAQPITDIAPVAVNLDPALAPIGTRVTMVGFGATAEGGGGMLGVQFALEGRTSGACSSFGLSDANLLCFSQTDRKGKCRGDSGGPSLAQINGRAVVVGVTSFGDQACTEFGADTRTDAEQPFLLAAIPNLGSCERDADCPGEICLHRQCIAQPFGDTGLGATCAAAVDCDSGQCAQGPDGKRCIELCTGGEPDACPAGFVCLGTTGAAGACWPETTDGGCCDASGRGAPTMIFGAAAVGLLLRRRRRR